MNKHLSIFCLKTHEFIHSLVGNERLDQFFNHRYRILADEYPHEPFSVEQSDLNFFFQTYEYLIGVRDIKEIPKSDYSDNYVKWINLHKNAK